MKRFLIVTLVALTANLFAVYQYGLNVEQENDYVAAVRDANGWTITAKTNVGLAMTNNDALLRSVNTHMKNVLDKLANGEFTPGNNAFGYMVYDTSTKTVLDKVELDFSTTDTNVINLAAGETIGFWMTIDGITYSSIVGVDGMTYNYSTMAGGDTNHERTMKVFNYANGWYRDGNSVYGYEGSFLFGVTDYKGGKVSGQPLPGVLAGLLIAGSAFGVSKFRRRVPQTK